MARTEYAIRLATAIVVGALAGCGGGGGGGGTTARATIGPAGGTLVSADGAISLTIPAGALGNPTAIVITELEGKDVPAPLRVPIVEKTYRLEPSGTRFALPARAKVLLPLGAPGDLLVLALDSEGTGVVEVANRQSIDEVDGGLVLEADIDHFSYAIVNRLPGVRATLTPSPASAQVGDPIRLDMVVSGTATEALTVTMEGSNGTYYEGGKVVEDVDITNLEGDFSPGVPGQVRGVWNVRCVAPGRVTAVWSYRLYNPFLSALFEGYLSPAGAHEMYTDRRSSASVECTAAPPPPPGPAVAVGLFNVPTGLSSLDGITYFGGPFANLAATGHFAAIAGAEGVRVFDLVTRQMLLDRTATGPDGATLGTHALGAIPVTQAASAGAPAVMIGFANDGASVQNWSAATSWGGTVRDSEPTFDVVSAGGGAVASTVALVRPVRGIDFVAYDATAGLYRSDPARTAPYAAFPGTGNLVSAHLLDDTGNLLVLGRAAGASISTSTKVFYKGVADAQATTLVSLGNVDARRLRCIPTGAKLSCVATLFGGSGKAFVFDPATPTATPRVTTLPAAAGTLGVAQALMPNGHLAMVMTNFSANVLTVLEVSPDHDTVYSSNTITPPTGCTAVAHVAILIDGEGMKAVVTCNGSNNYWVLRLFA